MKVLIFTEAGHDIGFGHVVRCISLYDALEKENIDVTFIIETELEKIELLEDRKAFCCEWTKGLNLDALFDETTYSIIDSYLAPVEVYKKIYTLSRRCLYIDDNKRLNYPLGLVVNPSVIDQSAIYETENKILSGHEYILLRRNFSKGAKVSINRHVKRVLIVLGGTDVHGLTPKVCETIIATNGNFGLDVVVKKSIEIHALESNGRVTVHESLNGEEMKGLIRSADVVICGAGQTMFELISLNTPFLPIVLADNQMNNVSYLKSMSLIKKAIYYKGQDISQDVVEGFEILSSYENRLQYFEKARAFIDGQGANRVIQEFLIDEV